MTGTIRTLALSSATIAVLLVFTGCFSIFIPSTGRSETRSESQLQPPTESPPTSEPPLPRLSSWPTPQVPLRCDQLLGESELVRAMRVPAASITAQLDVVEGWIVSTAQGGMLRCSWKSAVEAGRVSAVVDVLPDAATGYQAMASSSRGLGEPGLIGPNSFVDCPEDGVARTCYVKFEINGYWAELSFGGLYQTERGESALVKDATQVGTTIREALLEAGPLQPAFTPVPDAARPWVSCADIDKNGAFRRALDSPSLPRLQRVDYRDDRSMYWLAMQRGGYLSCRSKQVDLAGELSEVQIDMIPGAGWAWADLAAAIVATDADAEITVPGADSALIACSSEGRCTAHALVRGSYLDATAINDEMGAADARAGAIRALELAIAAL